MLDKFYYENSRGQMVEFGKDGVFANYNDIRDYSWQFNALNGVISGFDRVGIAEKKLPVVLIGDDAKSKRNDIHSVFETDIVAMKKGKLYVGNTYLNCWIYATTNSEYLDKWKMKTEFSIVTDDQFWHEDKKYSFVPGDNDTPPESDYLDYPYDYPYDFTIEKRVNGQIVNDSIVDSDFEIILYGASANPIVTIGTNSYGINDEILRDEYVRIDSVAKTITKVKKDGTNVNIFDRRNRDYYIFEPIASGIHPVIWVGSFGWDITIHKKWSEPKWI